LYVEREEVKGEGEREGEMGGRGIIWIEREVAFRRGEKPWLWVWKP
jgi:hypothetical protein